jgi:uncharacterized FAD-dependent dehydrogenase
MGLNKKENNIKKYKISQIILPIQHNTDDLKRKVIKQLRVKPEDLLDFVILKKSIDARKKPEIFYSYVVMVKLKDFLHKKMHNVENYQEIKYMPPKPIHKNSEKSYYRPIIVGTGPAGLFCGYILAKAGLQPLLLEQGESIEQRVIDVEEFWNTGIINPNSNVQFGEGGAGTFSDGKLNTLVKDKSGRNRFVLETLVEHGAPKEILYQQKPHVGTDILRTVVKNIRESIESLGGQIDFGTKLIDIIPTNILTERKDINFAMTIFDDGACIDKKKNTFVKVLVTNPNLATRESSILHTNHLVLAIGHSARDTFEMLYQRKLEMSAKSFAVGLRIEHSQKAINQSQYGNEFSKDLPAASYKLAEKLENGRGVYSFCMCPGGVVVNASSESKGITVNGMSYHKRDGENANSAIVVTVSHDDFPSNHPLGGMEFQRKIKKRAFELGEGKVPVQRLSDFFEGYCSLKYNELSGNIDNEAYKLLCEGIENINPAIKGQWHYADLRGLFPSEITNFIREGILRMSKKITGFSHPNAILSGVESRTSSPIRIHRNDEFQSNFNGVYPCGEGAGYAGGITSAAMDGIKVAEAILKSFSIVDL